MGDIFLTGATGFVGARVLRKLREGGSGPIRCLVRDPARWKGGETGNVQVVPGSLERPSAWEEALSGCDVVVHLAALTGKAREDEHFRVNAVATADLLERARASGVRRFLFVSTIAVTYPEKRWYPYARAKEEAESRVRASGMDWAILRPTIVLGPGSALDEKFRGLARAPVMPVFGSGKNRVQPVHVDDVADAVHALLEQDRLGERVSDLGGPEVLTMEDFLRRLRAMERGREGPVLRVPVRPLIRALALVEPILFPVLPAAAGQFYVFAHDAIAGPGEGEPLPRPATRSLEEMLTPPAFQPAERELDEECAVFCRHLTGVGPDEYVRRKYREAHLPGKNGPARQGADSLTEVARLGVRAARLADARAAVLSRGGTLRRKLILLLAILESHGATSRSVDTPERGSPAVLLARAALGAVSFAAAFLASVIAVPLLRGRARRRTRELRA